MTVSFTVRGGCPLGWETAIFDIGMLKNSKGGMVVFCYVKYYMVCYYDSTFV